MGGRWATFSDHGLRNIARGPCLCFHRCLHHKYKDNVTTNSYNIFPHIPIFGFFCRPFEVGWVSGWGKIEVSEFYRHSLLDAPIELVATHSACLVAIRIELGGDDSWQLIGRVHRMVTCPSSTPCQPNMYCFMVSIQQELHMFLWHVYGGISWWFTLHVHSLFFLTHLDFVSRIWTMQQIQTFYMQTGLW